MHTRNRIVLTLCLATFMWPCAGMAQAGEKPAATDQAIAAQDEPKESDDFKAVDEMPKVLTQVPPRYPDGARERGVQGTVQVRAWVKKNGKPVRVAVVAGKGVTPELDKAAVEAVSQWTFVPAKAKGKPVAVYIIIPVKFRLQ
jgi:protein TonB